MKVWLVIGETGQYSDHDDWIVAGYDEKEMALLHVDKLNNWLKENRLHTTDEDANNLADWGSDLEAKKLNPYDVRMRVDYTGTNYYIEETDLFSHLDQFLESLGE